MITQRLLSILSIIFLVILVSCRTSVPTEMDNAKLEALGELRAKNYPFSQDGFISAAQKGDIEALNLYIKAGIKINRKDSGTALVFAVDSGKIDSVKFLLDHGADANEDTFRGTPLGVASYEGFDDIIIFLISKGADVNQVGKDGMSPLFNAAVTGKTAAAEILIKNGADTNFKQPQTNESVLMATASKGQLDMVKLLISNGAEIEYRGVGGLSSLDWALLSEHFDVAEYLIKNGATVYNTKTGDCRPMIEALERNNTKILDLLIKNGADVNAKIHENMPLIVWAAKRNLTTGVKFLIDNGADISAADNSGMTALDYAIQNNNPEMQKFIKEKLK